MSNRTRLELLTKRATLVTAIDDLSSRLPYADSVVEVGDLESALDNLKSELDSVLESIDILDEEV